MSEDEVKEHVSFGFDSSHGRSSFYITCPFCQEDTKVFQWSLAGSGRKCKCGAIHWPRYTKKKVQLNKQ